MSKVLKITTPRANSLIKDTIKRFQVYFPKYIEKIKEFEVSLGYAPFLSKKLSSLYIEKNIEFDKLGILKEVGLKRESLG